MSSETGYDSNQWGFGNWYRRGISEESARRILPARSYRGFSPFNDSKVELPPEAGI